MDEHLDLSNLNLEAADLVDFLRDCSSLDLSQNPLFTAGVAGLLRWLPGGIQNLELRDCGLRSEAVDLLASGRFPALRRLDLSGNDFGGEALQRLARAPGFPALRELLLGKTPLPVDQRRLADQRPWVEDDLLALFGRRLETLSITAGSFEIRALAVLRQATPGLRRLSVPARGNYALDDEAACLLAQAACLRELEELRLPNNRIGDVGLRSLTRSPYLANLRALHLEGNPCRLQFDGDFRLLGELRALSIMASDPLAGGGLSMLKPLRLDELRLQGTLSDRLLQEVVELQPKLIGLHLGYGGGYGPAAMESLCRLPLQELSLVGPQFGQQGLAAFAELRNLRSLSISSLAHPLDLSPLRGLAKLETLHLPQIGLLGLQQASHLRKLRELEAYYWSPGERGAGTGLLRSLRLPCPQTARYPLDAAEMEMLSRSFHFPKLERLDLTDQSLGDEGARALCQASWSRNLRSLKLGGNSIGSDGAERLAHCSSLSGLLELDVSYNKLGPRGMGALAASPNLAGLQRLSAFNCGVLEHEDPWIDWGGAVVGSTPADPEALEARRRFGKRLKM